MESIEGDFLLIKYHKLMTTFFLRCRIGHVGKKVDISANRKRDFYGIY